MTVLSVTQDANDLVASANMFNDRPKGHNVLARMRTTYVESEKANHGLTSRVHWLTE